MIEWPEARVWARQLTERLAGRRITEVEAAHTPHGFAWYTDDPADYPARLLERRVESAEGFGIHVEIQAEDSRVVYNDGATLRYYAAGEKRPDKHQLYLGFDDGSGLYASCRMYGGFFAYPAGREEGAFLRRSKECPSPLDEDFDEAYFESLFDPNSLKLSAKAFLATKQRIPGLGNGVLQDILWNAGLHPRARIGELNDEGRHELFLCVKDTLKRMELAGGRASEKDIYGKPGGYECVLSSKTLGQACPRCGMPIEKAAYLGGSVYFCPGCQEGAK